MTITPNRRISVREIVLIFSYILVTLFMEQSMITAPLDVLPSDPSTGMMICSLFSALLTSTVLAVLILSTTSLMIRVFPSSNP